MKYLILIFFLSSLSLFAFTISFYSSGGLMFLPLPFLLSEEESTGDDPELEFPPMTKPAFDDAFIKTFNVEFIVICGTMTVTGIGLILYGFQDMIGLAEKGFFSYKLNKGVFLISSGLLLGGVSVIFLKSAIDSMTTDS